MVLGKDAIERIRSRRYQLSTLHYIKNRISVMGTEDEDKSKFIFRELVQNSDDALARTMVIRFESDCLYVANDGKSFDENDFLNISNILGGSKEFDKTTTGNFGSGFVTVF